jgi:hypothetical protein
MQQGKRESQAESAVLSMLTGGRPPKITHDYFFSLDDYGHDRYPQRDHSEGARCVNNVPTMCEQGSMKV